MDPGAADSPVTLVIKAPNQKHDDQTINCFLNWTVDRLKSHISKVYPGKPSSRDQRLVYSGKLLQDHLQLREVLRKQDGYHMMHLVCASRSPPGSPTPSLHTPDPASVTSDLSSRSSDSAGSTSSAPAPNQDGRPGPAPLSIAGNDNSLRHRGGSSPHNPSSTGVQWPGGSQPRPAVGGLAAGVPPPHPMYLPLHVLWWQQIYAQHYYMQYQAAVAASRPPSAAPPPPPSPSPSPQPNAQPNEAPPPLGPAPLPEDRPANQNIQMNAQGGPVLNDDELNRDWLDWLYTVARAAILVSIVYFYSSFGRFVMVMGAMLIIHLHQAGWFPFRPELQNLGGGGGGGGAEEGGGVPEQQEAERHLDIQEMERIMDEVVDEDEEEEDDSAGEEALHRPGVVASAWSFVSAFFTSLIPEGRPQPAN